jgi:trans-aconitate methyltransferase
MNLSTQSDETDDHWDGKLYQSTCSFVSDFGEELLDWLSPNPDETILDVGCGTGELTSKISNRGSIVSGLDSSSAMLDVAREEHPHLNFIHGDIVTFSGETPFDAVFSNAALHWIQQPEQAIQSIFANLRNGGRFVAEMGAKGNVESIRQALREELEDAGYDPETLDPWYFPEPGEYLQLLRDRGFTVQRAKSFSRPTELLGDEGMRVWLTMFAEDFFSPLTDRERKNIIASLLNRLRDSLYQDDRWILDYHRLRFKCVKS